MTPPIPINVTDIVADIVARIAEAALEAIHGPADHSKNNNPAAKGLTDKQAKELKLKEAAETQRKIQKLLYQQQHLLKKLEEYQKFLKSRGPIGKTALDDSRPWSFRDTLELGITAFCPYLLPLKEVASRLPDVRPFGLDLSLDGVVDGWREFHRQAEQSRKAFEESIAGAIWNPKSLDELSRGNLFVIEEDALNEIIASVIAKGPAANKVRNVHVTIDGDRLKIKGEYNTPLAWVDFSAILEFEQKDGKSEGSLKKIEAVGFDLTDYFKADILKAFGQLGLPAPENAELKDLSWIQLPGIKRLEIRRDTIVIERDPPPSGPS